MLNSGATCIYMGTFGPGVLMLLVARRLIPLLKVGFHQKKHVCFTL